MEEASMDASSKGMYNDVDNSSKGKENGIVGDRKIVMSQPNYQQTKLVN